MADAAKSGLVVGAIAVGVGVLAWAAGRKEETEGPGLPPDTEDLGAVSQECADLLTGRYTVQQAIFGLNQNLEEANYYIQTLDGFLATATPETPGYYETQAERSEAVALRNGLKQQLSEANATLIQYNNAIAAQGCE